MKALAIFAVALILAIGSGCSGHRRWHESSRESAGLAPLPAEEPQAVVQVYAARTWGWRGWFADHTWVSVKPAGAREYTVYEVIGWRRRDPDGYVRIVNDVPDRRWFGGEPNLLVDLRGETVDALITQIVDAVERYPYANRYKAFPGPNSNTFTAWIAREVPALGLRLPWRAVGRSYPLDGES